MFAFLLLLCAIFVITICIKINYIPVKIDNIYYNVYAMSSVVIATDKKEFKVLKISDTHLINGKTENDLKTLSYLESVLSQNSYDLIILNGDLVDGFTLNFSFNKYASIDSFARIVESCGVFWTFVPGNNDREMQGDNKRMISYLMQFEHFIIGNIMDIDGDVNFVIDIEKDGEVAHSIVLLDSHSRKIPIIGEYDYIKESQVEYLK